MAGTNPWTTRRIGFLAVRAILAVAFIAAAGAKLAGVPMIVAEFGTLGFGQWFRYLTALVEIGGSILLFVPGFAAAGAFLLAATVIFATLGHLFVFGGNPGPALVLLVLAGGVLWVRRGEIATLRRQVLG